MVDGALPASSRADVGASPRPTFRHLRVLRLDLIGHRVRVWSATARPAAADTLVLHDVVDQTRGSRSMNDARRVVTGG